MIHLRKVMLEELQRRNFSSETIRGYVREIRAESEAIVQVGKCGVVVSQGSIGKRTGTQRLGRVGVQIQGRGKILQGLYMITP